MGVAKAAMILGAAMAVMIVGVALVVGVAMVVMIAGVSMASFACSYSALRQHHERVGRASERYVQKV